MKEKVLLIILLIVISNAVNAQSRSTNETKLTLVVNKENTKILDLELFDEKQVDNINKKHPESKLFIGLLKGSYELEERRVKPNKGATITIFTNRQFYPNEKFFPKENLAAGEHLSIGSTEAKITSNREGELVLVAQ